MAETFRQDGKSVDVVAPFDVDKGEPLLVNGFHGVTVGSAKSGETVAVEVETRVHALNVGALSAPKGTKLYITAAHALTTTAGSNELFGKVVRAKDANNVAWVRIAAQ